MGQCNRRPWSLLQGVWGGEGEIVNYLRYWTAQFSHIRHERRSNLANTDITDSHINIWPQDREVHTAVETSARGPGGTDRTVIICVIDLVHTFSIGRYSSQTTMFWTKQFLLESGGSIGVYGWR